MSMENMTGQEVTLTMTQYIAARGNNHFARTLGTVPEKEAEYASTFEQIGRGWRFIK